jgi:putative ABC transport system permease protein
MQILLQDVRYAVRLLRKKALYTAVVVVTLALGIAAVTAVVSLVKAALLQPYGPIDANRWVYIWEHRAKAESLNQISVSIPNFRDWKANTTDVFAEMVVCLPWSYTASGPEISEPERVRAAVISPNAFSTIAAMPAAGRWLTEDDARSGERRVILSYGFWKRAYGRDLTLPGKTIRLNSATHTVVGIAPPGFAFPPEDLVDVWTVLPASALTSKDRAERGYRVIAKLRTGVTPKMAQSALNVITQRLSSQYAEDRDYDAILIPMREAVAGDFRIPLIALSGAVGFFLILLCLNIGYLRVVHLEARSKEIAVRMALGATRTMLVRHLLIETLLLFLVGGGLGFILAPVGLRLVLSPVPAREVSWVHARIDGSAFVAALCLTGIAAVLCGLLPVRRMLRRDLAGNLTAGVLSGSFAGRWRTSIIAGQIAIASIPLCGAGLLMRSFVNLQAVALGFDSEHRLTISISAPKVSYAGPMEITSLANEIRQVTKSIPGVKEDGLSQAIPFAPGPRWLQAISRVDPKGVKSASSFPMVRYSVVTPGYFEAIGIPLMSGRTVTDSDTHDSQQVVVINKKLARLYFPSEDPVGKLLWIGHAESLPESQPRVIAGVVGDTRMYAIESDPAPSAWVPMAQQTASDSIWRNLFLVVNAGADAVGILPTIRERIKAVDSDLAIADVYGLSERVSDSMWRQRLSTDVLAAFSLAALAIAVLGVFGVTSYTVALRSREIGIRIAVGAKPSNIRRMVIRHCLGQVIIGLVFGLVGAVGLTRLLRGLLFGVGPGDPLTFSFVAGSLVVAAFAASFIPAKRASTSDPSMALRIE